MIVDAFARVGSVATRDVLEFYSQFGGMEPMDDGFLKIWSVSEIVAENPVVAGIFLLRGSLGAARVISWFSAFMLSGFLLSSLIVFPWIQPLEYWLFGFREDPLGSLVSIVLALMALLMLFWVYTTLRAPPVLEARAAAGHRSGVPKSALVAGSAFAVIMAQISAQRAASCMVVPTWRSPIRLEPSVLWSICPPARAQQQQTRVRSSSPVRG